MRTYNDGVSNGVFRIFLFAGFGQKICLQDGSWFKHPDSNKTWSNYTTCVDLDDLKVGVFQFFFSALSRPFLSVRFYYPVVPDEVAFSSWSLRVFVKSTIRLIRWKESQPRSRLLALFAYPAHITRVLIDKSLGRTYFQQRFVVEFNNFCRLSPRPRRKHRNAQRRKTTVVCRRARRLDKIIKLQRRIFILSVSLAFVNTPRTGMPSRPGGRKAWFRVRSIFLGTQFRTSSNQQWTVQMILKTTRFRPITRAVWPVY